ncbi:deubiquitinase and deneddylase Dub1 [Striga asiatica]|uniref:Deubiquitinase and deneddylase Dub1 n=1 Tax=Striga asiatica TaxID=4170 RepID=A0A5A7Q985_STRAF|nr:deubiquitinase and deneddylase Dub1 [Striga asiatica]
MLLGLLPAGLEEVFIQGFIELNMKPTVVFLAPTYQTDYIFVLCFLLSHHGSQTIQLGLRSSRFFDDFLLEMQKLSSPCNTKVQPKGFGQAHACYYKEGHTM